MNDHAQLFLFESKPVRWKLVYLETPGINGKTIKKLHQLQLLDDLF